MAPTFYISERQGHCDILVLIRGLLIHGISIHAIKDKVSDGHQLECSLMAKSLDELEGSSGHFFMSLLFSVSHTPYQ